jgi:hypothetical protein
MGQAGKREQEKLETSLSPASRRTSHAVLGANQRTQMKTFLFYSDRKPFVKKSSSSFGLFDWFLLPGNPSHWKHIRR